VGAAAEFHGGAAEADYGADRHRRWRAIPGARLIILPDVSHFGMLQSPQELSDAVIGFLK
jgi:pimeloyl-ACP methyl ester carboxylesterase